MKVVINAEKKYSTTKLVLGGYVFILRCCFVAFFISRMKTHCAQGEGDVSLLFANHQLNNEIASLVYLLKFKNCNGDETYFD